MTLVGIRPALYVMPIWKRNGWPIGATQHPGEYGLCASELMALVLKFSANNGVVPVTEIETGKPKAWQSSSNERIDSLYSVVVGDGNSERLCSSAAG